MIVEDGESRKATTFNFVDGPRQQGSTPCIVRSTKESSWRQVQPETRHHIDGVSAAGLAVMLCESSDIAKRCGGAVSEKTQGQI